MATQRFPTHLEYKKDPKLSRDVVLHIMDWTKNQPHLPNATEEDIILFVSSCQYSTEVAKQTIDNYFTYRTHIPEIFQDRDPTVKDSYMDKTCGIYTVLPGLTDEGYKVLYIKISNIDFSKYNVVTELKTFMICQDQMLFEEGAQKGWILVYDMEGMQTNLITHISPSILKKFAMYFMEATPIQLKSFHLIHPTSLVDSLVSLLKPAIKSRVNLLHVHKNVEDLYKFVPKRNLPLELGGDLQSYDIIDDEYKERVKLNKEWILAEEKLRVNESLRPGIQKNARDIFGVEGSFRKLELD